MTREYRARHTTYLSESTSASLGDWAKARGYTVAEAIRALIVRELEPESTGSSGLGDEIAMMHSVAISLPRSLVRDWLGDAALEAGTGAIDAEVIRLIEHARSLSPAERSAALREAQVLEYLFVAMSNLIHQQYPKEAGKILEYAQARVLQHWSHLVDKGGAHAKP